MEETWKNAMDCAMTLTTPANWNVTTMDNLAIQKEWNFILHHPQGYLLATADNSNIIWKIQPVTGSVTEYAGVESNTDDEFRDGPSSRALFHRPHTLVLTYDGCVVVSDRRNNCIRCITPDGKVVSTLAGDPFKPGGYADGDALCALFKDPTGICVGSDNSLYICDTYNSVIRKLKEGVVTTVAGNTLCRHVDNTSENASFFHPTCIVVDSNNDLLVSDTMNRVIRKIHVTKCYVTTIAGIPREAGVPYMYRGTYIDGLACKVPMYPLQLIVDDSDNIFFIDHYDVVRILDTTRYTARIAGAEEELFVDGVGGVSRFCYANNISISHDGNIYVTDSGTGMDSDGRIRILKHNTIKIGLPYLLRDIYERTMRPSVVQHVNFSLALNPACYYPDVYFYCVRDDVTFPAHRAILAARCDPFRAMFTVGRTIEGSQNTTIRLHDVSACTFRVFLMYVYTEHVEKILTDDLLLDVYYMSQQYMVHRLMNICKMRVLAIKDENILRNMLTCVSSRGLVDELYVVIETKLKSMLLV